MKSDLMNKADIERLITINVLKHLAENRQYCVPAAVSGRHIHLSLKDAAVLFGQGYQLRKLRFLSQPGQYVCQEKLKIAGPKGWIDGMRVLGPERPETQVEVSVTDTFKLGVEAAVKMSGDIAGTPGCVLIGPAGEVTLRQGVIVSARHLHISADEAQAYGVDNGDIVSVKKTGGRETIFEEVIVRAGHSHSLELHIDMDEANAACIKSGDLLELIKS